jgi:tripartite-type tricarboxylate transporter receptor subunit TctC
MSDKISVVSIGLILCFGFSCFAAEPFPSKEIEITVPFDPGGGMDLLARVVASSMSETLGKPVVVVNKPGASGTIGTALLAKRKPDGYSLMTVSPSPILFAPHLQKVEYNPLKDLAYVAGVVAQPFGVQVRPDAPWKTFQDLLDDAKRNPGKIKYGTDGVNSWGSIYMACIAKDRGITWTNIPFKGDGTLLPAFLGGHVDVAVMSVVWVPQAKAGKLRPLVFVTEKRFADFPDCPILNEFGFNYFLGAGSVCGFGAPKGLPEDILKKLEDAIQRATESPQFKDTAKRVSYEVDFRNSREFTQQVEKGFDSIGEMMKKAGIKQ